MNLEDKEVMEEKEVEELEDDGSHLEAATQMNEAAGRLIFCLG